MSRDSAPSTARTRLAAIIGMVGLALVLSSMVVRSGPVEAQSDDETPSPAPNGAELYATQCVSCHGVSGAGVEDLGPSLLVEGPAAVDFVLRTGRMPLAKPSQQAVRGPSRYSEAEIVALVDFVGSLGTGPSIPEVDIAAADVTNGGALFRLNCAACHVATGAGSVIGADRRAPSLALSTPVQVGEAIVVGPGAMPVFADLSTAQINDIAAYVSVLQDDRTTTPRGLGGVGPVAEGLAAWLLGLVPLVALTRWIGRGRNDVIRQPSLEEAKPGKDPERATS